MVDYLPRSAWGARTPRPGPGPLTVARVEGVALHWPGMGTRRLVDQADVAEALRGWQDYHMDGRGWSDIAYQAAVDQAGRAWELRGLVTQSGANGDTDVNERYGAVLLIVGTGEAPSPALIATTREVVADFRRLYPAGTEIVPHSQIRPAGTDCPGDPVRELIRTGAFNPITHEEFDMPMSQEEFEASLGRVLDAKLSKFVTGDNAHDSQVIAWQVAAQAYADKRFAEGADFDTVKNEVWAKIRPLWAS